MAGGAGASREAQGLPAAVSASPAVPARSRAPGGWGAPKDGGPAELCSSPTAEGRPCTALPQYQKRPGDRARGTRRHPVGRSQSPAPAPAPSPRPPLFRPDPPPVPSGRAALGARPARPQEHARPRSLPAACARFRVALQRRKKRNRAREDRMTE
jgi:hypothetical protein